MGQLHIPASHGVAHNKKPAHTVDRRCRGTHRHQSIHIRSAVQQGFKTVFKVFPVQVHNRKRQNKLRQSKHHHVLMPQQNFRKRPSKHMPHGYIHQYN